MTVPTWGNNGLPGHSEARFNEERAPLFQSFFFGDVVMASNPVINSAAVDSGNSVTTNLRPGLVMAQLDSDGSWTNYDPDATNGAEVARGVLVMEINMRNRATGAAATQFRNAIVVGGKLKSDELIGLDYQAREQLSMHNKFIFEKNWHGNWRPVIKATDYTVVAADHGKTFHTTGAAGAVAFTLPTIAVGLHYRFLNTADQNMTITSAAGNDIITFNDLAASSLAFSTSSQKIGAFVDIKAQYINGTLKWVAQVPNSNTLTVT